MHNHDGGNNKSMMWMMVICCAVPLLLIILFGLGGKAFGASTWVVFGGVAVMLVAHFFMMGKSHKHSSGSDEKNEITREEGKNNKDNQTHSGHGSCH